MTRRASRPLEDMIDLHCHILPGIDDGAADIAVSIQMARMFVDDGVSVVAATPHILPGLYANTGQQIRAAISSLQGVFEAEGIPLRLVSGADNHIVPNFVSELRSGHLLSLADSRYVLVEPPHHIPPPRMEELFFNIQVAGYVPILTHPERLTWINSHYDTIARLATGGVVMQITAGSLAGAFGRNARYWAEKMLAEGLRPHPRNGCTRHRAASPKFEFGARYRGEERGHRRGHQNGAFSAFRDPIKPNAKQSF